MKTITGLGKLLATLFWCVVLVNLLSPFAQPFSTLLTLAGLAVLVLHLGELVLFNAQLRARPNLAIERAKVLVFGIFHIAALPVAEPTAAPVSVELAEGAACAS